MIRPEDVAAFETRLIGQSCINCRKVFHAEHVVGLCERCKRICEHYSQNPDKPFIDDEAEQELSELLGAGK